MPTDEYTHDVNGVWNWLAETEGLYLYSGDEGCRTPWMSLRWDDETSHSFDSNALRDLVYHPKSRYSGALSTKELMLLVRETNPDGPVDFSE